jgi:hypothetical protein
MIYLINLGSWLGRHPVTLTFLSLLVGNVILSPFSGEIRWLLRIMPANLLRRTRQRALLLQLHRLDELHENSYKLLLYVMRYTSMGVLCGSIFSLCAFLICHRLYEWHHPKTSLYDSNLHTLAIQWMLVGMLDAVMVTSFNVYRTLVHLTNFADSKQKLMKALVKHQR